MVDPSTLMADVGAAMDRVRADRPLVQCLTNHVVSQITADVLLAIGASPAMVDNPAEAGHFAQLASSVLVNVGTPTEQTIAAMLAAASATNGPWVLDPVAVGALEFRTTACHDLLEHSPTAIRGNASEIAALAGQGTGGRGVDAVDDVLATLPAAVDLSRRTGAVVAVSGPVDLVVLGQQAIRIEGGHPMMAQVIGTGCALGAMVAAHLAVTDDPLVATVAAHAHTAAAGSVAAQHAAAPGSFGVAWRDALFTLDGPALQSHVRLQEVEA